MVDLDLGVERRPWRTPHAMIEVVSELGAFALKLNIQEGQPLLDIAAGSDARILDLFRRISEDPAKPWKISEIAAEVGISRGHLNHLCRSSMNIELKRFVIEKRLERGRHILGNSSNRKSIKEISIACGFASQAYFARQFKKHYGMFPSAYRAEKAR